MQSLSNEQDEKGHPKPRTEPPDDMELSQQANDGPHPNDGREEPE